MVPEVFEFGQDGDDFYIAMALVEGPSLEERLRAGALACDEAVGHALWLCAFLARAHAFSVTIEQRPYRLLHNDLKPAHLKIPATGERNVLDFGIAKVLEETRELATDVGRTIAYAAPERLRSERVNVHADFWSLGVMLYEMVSGHRPTGNWRDPRLRRQLYSAITTNAPRAPLPPDCPPHLQAIIHRLLAFQPAHRYQSADEIHADLERYVRRETPVAVAYYETPGDDPGDAHGSRGCRDGAARCSDGAPGDRTASTSHRSCTDLHHAGSLHSGRRRRRRRENAGRDPPISVASARGRDLHSRPGSAVVATEGVAWLFAERFRDTVPAMDERTVIAGREAYDAVERWSSARPGSQGTQ